MNKLSLWCLITINTCSFSGSENPCLKNYSDISLTSILLPKADRTIDLEYIEPFRERPIKNFILETKETDTPWLFTLCHNEMNDYHVYNALDFMAWYAESNKDPLTKSQITGLDFFICEHSNEQLHINHVGATQDLFNQKSLLRLLFSYITSTEIECKNNIALHISNFYSGQMHDLPSAIRWCQKAAKNNDLNAIAELGYLFKEYGDLNKAFFYLQDAAERGDIYAAINLGYLHAKKENFGLAFQWLKIGADKGVPEAMRQLGNLHYKLGETNKAIHWLTEAMALHNNPATMVDLAFAHRTKKQFDKAIDLYVRAAELNYPTLDLFYTLHLAIGHPAHEKASDLEKYANMLVDRINTHDQEIASFQQEVPDRYQMAVDMIERYATKPILHPQEQREPYLRGDSTDYKSIGILKKKK